ncbi:unnamed protein product [Sphagnum jensenii]|uniref:30S ribosomal protein S13, chloroplastic n=1 Tax=Sphagnum jensenii TaxID=128206 RepID=A0ABP1AJP9_9BRYO
MAGMAATLLAPALSAVVLGSVGISQNSVAKKTSPPVSLSLSGTSKVGGLNIRGARVGGVEIPNSKRIETALQYIHGVGATTARQILLDIGMENKLSRELSEEDLTNLRDEVSKYMVEGDLRRFNLLAIKRLKDIQCYRGKRHIQGLPCRGQHTKCNARTRRGKKVTIAGKKKAPGK